MEGEIGEFIFLSQSDMKSMIKATYFPMCLFPGIELVDGRQGVGYSKKWECDKDQHLQGQVRGYCDSGGRGGVTSKSNFKYFLLNKVQYVWSLNEVSNALLLLMH